MQILLKEMCAVMQNMKESIFQCSHDVILTSITVKFSGPTA